MSERKSINKYYPPDYDPSLIKKKKKNLNDRQSTTIRLMLPFSLKCVHCGEFIAKSRKFNGKKETLKEKYLDKIKIYRFTIRCCRCAQSIIFKTDPKSSDYILESGAKKIFDADSGNGDENLSSNVAIKENETTDETLERLAKQQDEDQDNEKELDKLQNIEDKLTALQRQQENYEELLHIKKLNNMKIHNIEKILDEKLTPDMTEVIQLVNERFPKTENPNDDLKSVDKLNDTDTSKTHLNEDVKGLIVKKKLILKKSNKKNSLGIRKKK